MKLGIAEGTSEGMLCNDNDAANCRAADAFSTQLIQLRLLPSVCTACVLTSFKYKAQDR